ncbi:MAG: rod shape-determining protein MreC [Pseudomonadota bacterium]|jgi:rod shape-determining protein MreC
MMILDHQYQHMGHVRSFLATVLTPLQHAIQFPIRSVDRLIEYLKPINVLVSENQALKHEKFLQDGRLQRLLAIESENARLRGLLKSMPRESLKYGVAEIIQIDPTPDKHYVLLNQGLNAGFSVGQPVIDAEGIVGEVVEVYPFSCKVMLLTDRTHAIPVENARNQVRGIVQGLGTLHELKLQHVLNSTDIQVGDVLITSGLGGHYPYGYPVGRVKAVLQVPGEPFASFSIEPFARLDRIREVLLIKLDESVTKIEG